MTCARLILCEKTSRWAGAFRAALGSNEALLQTRSLSQCKEELRRSPWSIVAIEVSAANSAAVLEFAGELGWQYPNGRLVVLLDADAAATEPLWREAGAIAVLTAAPQAPACARLVRRRLALAPPPVAPGLRAALASRLPWSRWTSAASATQE